MERFTLDQYAGAVRGTGRRCVRGAKGLVAQCLRHDERNPSMEIFPDGWCQCYAGCGRFHISHVFPEFRDPDWRPEPGAPTTRRNPMTTPMTTEQRPKEYRRYDLLPEWGAMPPIPRDHRFKVVPLEVLDGLGWRWTDGVAGMGPGYFIPYFTSDRKRIPFAQVRHLSGERRFTFLPGAEMRVLGKWNLYDGEKVFVVEGPSDGAVLEACGVPWVALPSASCVALAADLARYCLKHDIRLIYAGDNDEPGEKLRLAVDDIAPYRVCQPPKAYKDWGDWAEAVGLEAVAEFVNSEYMEDDTPPMVALAAGVFATGGSDQPSML